MIKNNFTSRVPCACDTANLKYAITSLAPRRDRSITQVPGHYDHSLVVATYAAITATNVNISILGLYLIFLYPFNTQGYLIVDP